MKIIIMCLFFLMACTTTQSPQRARFTPAVAKVLLKKGMTTQAEILSQWGSPNMVTRNASGAEVWSYSKQSFDAKKSSGGGAFFFVGGSSAVSSATTSSFEVIITFDSNDVVQDFSITSTQY